MAFIDFAFFAVKGLICIWAAILILVGSRFLEDLIRGSDPTRPIKNAPKAV